MSGADALSNYLTLNVRNAKWKEYGKMAGPMRNQAMVNMKPDLCVAFVGGKGTHDCVKRARLAGIKVVKEDVDF